MKPKRRLGRGRVYRIAQDVVPASHPMHVFITSTWSANFPHPGDEERVIAGTI